LRGWQHLEERVISLRSELAERSKKVSAQKKHAAERRIRDLESRGDGTGREVLIKVLKKKLTEPN
jgi:predicted RNase H-like nuclease (RuvC/YqgF family)